MLLAFCLLSYPFCVCTIPACIYAVKHYNKRFAHSTFNLLVLLLIACIGLISLTMCITGHNTGNISRPKNRTSVLAFSWIIGPILLTFDLNWHNVWNNAWFLRERTVTNRISWKIGLTSWSLVGWNSKTQLVLGKNGLKSPLCERMGSISDHMVPENGRSQERSGSIRLSGVVCGGGVDLIKWAQIGVRTRFEWKIKRAYSFTSRPILSCMRERAHFCRARRVKRWYQKNTQC